MTDQPAPTPSDATVPPAAASPRPVGPTPVGLRILGLALIVPAGIAWLWTYVVPTVQTALESFQRTSMLNRLGREDAPTEWVAGDNYARLFEDGVATSFLHATVFALVPLLVALVVAPLVALLADGAGKVARLTTRALLVAPIAFYAPTTVLAAWVRDDRVEFRTAREWPVLTSVQMLAAVGFGLITALAATAFLSALRRQAGEGRARRWQAASVVGAVIALAIIAYSMQIFAVPFVLGRSADTRVPMSDVMRSLMTMDLGTGMAASTLLLVVLAVLGTAATAVLLTTRTRLELRERAPRAHADLRWLLPLAALLLAGVAATLYVVWPMFSLFGEDATRPGLRDLSAGAIVFNTWAPTLISTIIGVGVAALAGFGIGALRPLGRFSELLLLPFAPWLFVTVGPLVLVGFDRARASDSLGTFLGLIPPSWLSIPALFVFTLLGRGQHRRWLQARAAGGDVADFWRLLVAPQLPMVAVVGVVTWVLSAQDLIWPYVVGNHPDYRPAPLVAAMDLSSPLRSGSVGDALLASLPVVLILGLGLVAAQLLYLDRIAVRVGRVDAAEATPDGTGLVIPSPAGSGPASTLPTEVTAAPLS